MRGGVLFAVVGDPSGGHFIEAPMRQADMSELARSVATSGMRFYCSSALGGCGEPLIVVNGAERRVRIGCLTFCSVCG